MIISASRRTDLPQYYFPWFLNRIKERFLYVRNPMNLHQVSCLSLAPDVVDCIVFWTKNPENALAGLDRLKEYSYYFQFTLTGYGRDVEPGILDKRGRLIPVFQELSRKIGAFRVIWRYDPIFFNAAYTMEYHKKAFRAIAQELNGYTERVVISFLDFYRGMAANMKTLGAVPAKKEQMRSLASALVEIADKNHMTAESCAEAVDLEDVGIRHGSCIDQCLIERVVGTALTGKKDKNQRLECGCMESIDIGAYGTCKTGCRYCYAMGRNGYRTLEQPNQNSPLLFGTIGKEDVIRSRPMVSLKEYRQLSLPF